MDFDVQRDVTLDVDPELAWELVTRPDDLSTWLGEEVELDAVPGTAGRVRDEDGTERRLVIEDVRPGEQLTWRWWTVGPDESPDEGPSASTVRISLHPTDGGTRVTIVESPTVPGASASLAARSTWSGRLAGLELRVLLLAVARA